MKAVPVKLRASKRMVFAGLLGCTAMIPVPLLAQEAPQKTFSLKVLGYNIWNKGVGGYFWDPAAKALQQLKFRDEMKALINQVKPDVVALPELNNNRGLPPAGWSQQKVSTTIINEMLAGMNLANAGKPGYVAASTNAGSDGTDGDVFSTLPMQDTGQDNTVILSPTNGFPKTYFTSSHLCYYDGAGDLCGGAGSSRIAEAKVYNQNAAARILPTILAGDFNAGDVSERGLERASQQELILRGAAGGNAFYQRLARQYAQMAAAAGKTGTPAYVDAYIKAGNKNAAITGGIFVDETYPVADNIPQTMNILKQEYQMIQRPQDQEPFKPHASANDGSSTWTTLGHDNTNTWASWDHVKIDHIMASRPFAKWMITDPNDPRVGVLYSYGDFQDGNSTSSMSDHQPYAQGLIWVGPQLEGYRDGNTDKTRLIWGKDVYDFAGRNRTFYLTRNTMRSDMFLGQLSDANGIPFYASPTASLRSDQDLGVLLAYAVYDRGGVDQAGSRATLLNYVKPDQLALYNDYLTKLSTSGTSNFYRTVIQAYFDAHRDEFPGISGIGSMSWEQWGDILIKTVKTGGLTFSNEDVRVAGALQELSTALGLSDPVIRQQYATRYGLDFDRDPNAALKIPLDCGNAGMLSLKGAKASCVDSHDFIGETLVRDKGTVIVEEDAALGKPDARLRLADGRLLVKGTAMTSLDRQVSLEGAGGTIHVAEAANSLTAGQKISGDGALTKEGNGTLVLGAVNDYKGGTTVQAGTLRAGVSGAFVDRTNYAVATGATLDLNGFNLTASALQGNGSVALGAATLMLDLPGASRFGGTIGGNGGLTKSGVGKQTLAGETSYRGDTKIVGGTLQFGDGANSGVGLAGSILVSGGAGLAFDAPKTFSIGGTLDFGDASTLSIKSGGGQPSLKAGSIRLGNGVTFNLNGVSDLSQASQVLIDSAAVIQGDFGTVNVGGFNGAVDYLTFSTRISADGRQYLVSYDLKWATANSPTSGTFTLSDAANSFTVATTLSDQAGNAGWDGRSLTKAGAGTLILSANNSYSGGTTVAGGTLQIGNGGTTGSIAGNVANNGTLSFNRSDALTFGGVISGSGQLLQTGAGLLKLTGDSSGFAGSTAVQAGTLSVDGKLGGTVAVQSGGRLQGTGTLGGLGVGSGGTAAPGNSIGTLNVAGDVSFAAGSTYEVEVNAAGASDRIAATGKATIAGGTVQVLAGRGNYAWQTDYTILTAAGGRSGSFDGVTSNLAFLSPLLGYDANNVYLRLARNDVRFASIGETANQRSTGAAIETLGSGNAVFDAIVQSDASGARAAFDGLSGEINASTVTGLIEDSRLTRDAINDRLRSAFETVGAKPLPLMGYGDDTKDITTASVASERYGAWGSAFGSWGSTDSDGNAGRLSRSTGGFVTGIDGFVTDDWRLGFLAGYSHSSFKGDDRRSSASSDNYHLGIYAGTQMGALSLRSGLAYSWSDIDSSRQVSLPGLTDGLSGSYRAGTTQVFGELGYAIKAGNIAFEPFANLAYVNVHTNGFTEKGGSAALTVQGGSNDITFTTLGVRASTDFDLGSMKAIARGMLGWRHGFGDVTPTVAQAFAGSNAFTIAGAPIARDSAVIEAGLDFAIAPQATLGISYQGQIGSKAHDHGVRADLSIKF